MLPFLLLSVVGAGAEPPKASDMSKLEQLVSTMAAGQESAAAAPKPAATDADVVILEEMEQHRQLRECTCSTYSIGATANTEDVCIKSGRGGGDCRPYNGGCPAEYHYCTTQSLPAASPNPEADSRQLQEQSEPAAYINAMVQLAVPSSLTSHAAAPAAEAFASFFALKAGVTSTFVQTQTTWGASAGAGSGPTLSVHVTIHLPDSRRRRDVEAQVRELAQLVVGGRTFDVVQVNIFPSVDFPLVCTPESESIKDETKALLQQLVELKQQELALMRAALSAGAETCSTTAVQALASHIGMPLK